MLLPEALGTNQVLGWRVNDDPAVVADMQHMHVELVNLAPAGGFFVAFQVAFYGGMVIAAPIRYTTKIMPSCAVCMLNGGAAR